MYVATLYRMQSVYLFEILLWVIGFDINPSPTLLSQNSWPPPLYCLWRHLWTTLSYFRQVQTPSQNIKDGTCLKFRENKYEISQLSFYRLHWKIVCTAVRANRMWIIRPILGLSLLVCLKYSFPSMSDFLRKILNIPRCTNKLQHSSDGYCYIPVPTLWLRYSWYKRVFDF